MKFDIHKSFKFRLALLFSAILFAFASIIIVLFNITINNYLSTRQQPNRTGQQQPQQPPKDDKDSALRAQYTKDLETVQQESIYLLGLLAVGSLLIGYFIADRFLRPLNKLNMQIGELSQHNLGSQITEIPDNEFGVTIKYFNAMSQRLKRSFEQQSQFVQDASHELRTPLTILRTNLDTVLDNQKATNAQLRKSMEEALQEIDYATDLANNLLALTKDNTTKNSVFSLNTVVSEIIDKYQHVSKTKSVKIAVLLCNEDIYVTANRLNITRAINNIFDNALKYSAIAKNPLVTVVVSNEHKYASVSIEDNGPGIPKEYHSTIFDRFVRVDESRDRQTGGFGLGLAISKKIITESGGKISLNSKPSKTIFTVTLPISKS